MKTCRTCHRELPLTDFYRRSGKPSYFSDCKKCHCANGWATRKRSFITDPEKLAQQRAYGRRWLTVKKYGMTVEEAEAMLAEGCRICGGAATVIDHCHATTRVRGGLCQPCNLGLGHFHDDPSRLEAAIAYLAL